MPRRAFRLEPLLRARARDEALAAIINARAQYVAAEAQRRQTEATRRLEAAAAGIAALHGLSLHTVQAHLDVLRRVATDLHAEREHAQCAATAARERLLEAARARAVLEHLRDRQLEAAARSRRTAEERERDDLSLRRTADEDCT